jgi:hypothetical protein
MLEPTVSSRLERVVDANDAETDTAAWFERAILGVLPDLVGTARRLTRHGADAEDLAAQASNAAKFGTLGINFRARKARDAAEWEAASAALHRTVTPR